MASKDRGIGKDVNDDDDSPTPAETEGKSGLLVSISTSKHWQIPEYLKVGKLVTKKNLVWNLCHI